MNSDKFEYFPATTPDPLNKYVQPKEYSVDMGQNGYPESIDKTQTVKTRGTGAATKGNKHSNNTQ
jgi:hypothetical protein